MNFLWGELLPGLGAQILPVKQTCLLLEDMVGLIPRGFLSRVLPVLLVADSGGYIILNARYDGRLYGSL